jgi:hypothetical protein
MNEFMSKGQAHLWNLEFDTLRWKVRYALNNIDSLSERNDVKGALEVVLDRLNSLCEATEGEDDE